MGKICGSSCGEKPRREAGRIGWIHCVQMLKSSCISLRNRVKLEWKHEKRQATGCCSTPWPCVSDHTTQHSNRKIVPQAYYIRFFPE